MDRKVLGKHFSDVYSTRFTKVVAQVFSQAVEQKCTQHITYSLKTKEIYYIIEQDLPETEYWFEARVTPISLQHFDEPLVLWNVRDITQRVKLEREIKQLIDYDDLTKIYNRRKFLTYLSDYNGIFKRYEKK